MEPNAYETQEIELGDIPQANPSANDLKRAARERVRLNKAWEIGVKAEQQVSKGDTLGLVGTTGRSTGTHLFFGIRWHGARINPQFLLEDPAKIPAVAAVARE